MWGTLTHEIDIGIECIHPLFCIKVGVHILFEMPV